MRRRRLRCGPSGGVSRLGIVALGTLGMTGSLDDRKKGNS